MLLAFLALPVATILVHFDAPAQERTVDPDAFSLDDWPLEGAAARGQVVFENYCIGCHGPTGEGNGPAAEYLNPQPRNFQRGGFKFRSTPYGATPTRADLLRTITCGLPGSSMPGFPLVSEPQRQDVVEYVLYLYSFGRAVREVTFYREDEGLSMDDLRGDRLAVIRAEVLAGMRQDAQPVAISDMPDLDAAATVRGKALFLKQCASCHGDTGIGDGPSSNALRDWKDDVIVPRDFTPGVYRSGSTPRDLFLRLKTGITGTPMPATSGTDQDLWDLVAYIRSIEDPNAPLPKHIRAGCGAKGGPK